MTLPLGKLFQRIQFQRPDHLENINRLQDQVEDMAIAMDRRIQSIATSITNNFDAGPWLNPAIRYVSPIGSDSASGLGWDTAMATTYRAYQDLVQAGGGEIHFADMSRVGGPVANQGHWVRGDGLDVPGWLPAVPHRLVGHGGVSMPFGKPAARLIGGIPITNPAADRMHPLLWLAANSQKQIILENIIPAFSANDVCQVGRFGWDYRRDLSTGAIELANITTWDRAGGAAELTVTLPPGQPITSATRTGTTVRLNLPTQKVVDFYSVGLPIRVTSTDPDFPSGDFTVTAVAGNNTWLEYTQAGAAVTALAIGTWASHGVMARDRIEVTSIDAEVPTTMYLVTAVTIDTITVVDPYGYAPRSATVTVNNPGTYVLQDRSFFYATGLLDIINVSGAVAPLQATDNFIPGPTMDFGGTTDGRIDYSRSACTGYTPLDSTGDADRCAWLLADGGSRGAAGLSVRYHQPGGTGIRIYGARLLSWGINAIWVHGDTDISLAAPPALEIINGGGNGTIYGRDVLTYDNDSGVPNIRSDANQDTQHFENCGYVEANGIVNSVNWSGRSISPAAGGQTGFWLDRISGDHPGHRRQFSPIVSRYYNWIQNDTATWDLDGGNITVAPIDDPMGNTNAVRFTRVAGTEGVYLLPQDVNNNPHTGSPVVHAVGDRWVMGAWFRKDGGLPGTLFSFNMAGNNGNFGFTKTRPFAGDGEWQWVVASATIETVDSSGSGFRCIVNAEAGFVGQTVDMFDPFLTRVPSGEMTDNEFAEYVQSLQPVSYYLPEGHVGTREGVPLHGHGGLYAEDLIPGGNVLANADGRLIIGTDPGAVTDVTATVPATSTGGTTPDIGVLYDNDSITLNGSDELQRAALTGDVEAPAGDNATAFRDFAALSVLANATNGTAVPSDLGGGSVGDVLQVVAGPVLAWAPPPVAPGTLLATYTFLVRFIGTAGALIDSFPRQLAAAHADGESDTGDDTDARGYPFTGLVNASSYSMTVVTLNGDSRTVDSGDWTWTFSLLKNGAAVGGATVAVDSGGSGADFDSADAAEAFTANASSVGVSVQGAQVSGTSTTGTLIATVTVSLYA